jgi:hypothetical protein
MQAVAYIDAPATEYTDTGLTPSTNYHYRIAVIDSENREGLLSNSYHSATTRTTNIPPSNLTATVHGQVITLEWEPVAGASTYYIYGAFAEAGPYALIDYNSASTFGTVYNVSGMTPYTSVSLNANTTYYFKVATSSSGPMSAPVSATTGP